MRLIHFLPYKKEPCTGLTDTNHFSKRKVDARPSPCRFQCDTFHHETKKTFDLAIEMVIDLKNWTISANHSNQPLEVDNVGEVQQMLRLSDFLDLSFILPLAHGSKSHNSQKFVRIE